MLIQGDIASTMDKLTTRALQAQVEAAVSHISADHLSDVVGSCIDMQNVDRENSNKVKQEEGALSVARIKAKASNVMFLHFNWHIPTHCWFRHKLTRKRMAL
jgi:hypothetical protein